ncbi:Fe-S oxidoreductase [Frankia casuarinae]|jgi:radical SAM superfamily enzyme YgiQ (UPF0313 family)|uniref:Cobalamin B12-binding n=1 Tax=Frankia casuarinae (strain DSM 45818 / CECT 9043 / HFP020203 / CcI3) TaxID=106370 RepID=Q2J7L7_FRACC|nr:MULTISPECIES: radical SAM protein [Frankia]ABD12725.1 cobalamin B12-binding [Frankia casuarinae]ETA00467.1 Fe-S oxidoreductase [Frankia sp. CcI6]EYT91016.1 Fe-S oxidoreductase [Frankia casuarinae]KEZ37025.1 Fe-S oxidoreductase [Frankia sp. CeD]OHV49233.1 hypothetical protein CgIS1_21435 [Frankia sp. CgIS1]
MTWTPAEGAPRILLIKPPIRACMIEIGRHMPIGLAYLASRLRAAGMQVDIFDALANTEDNHVVDPADYTAADRAKVAAHPRWGHLVHWGARWDRLEQQLRRGYDLVGVSCMFTPYYEPAYELGRLARRILPHARVVLGGQHPTVAFQHAMTEPAFDALVLGEAESNVVEIVQALLDGAPLTGLAGVAYRCGTGLCGCPPGGPGVHVQPRTEFLTDLDGLPLPAVNLLEMSSYDSTATLITSRGCPFSCSFCTVHATVGRKFRARSPHNVADEIEHYVTDHGIRRFFVEDDNFTFDVPRVREICREITRRGLDVELHLPNGMTVVDLDGSLVDDMVSAGFRSLFLGLETTDPVRLRRIRKGFTSLQKVNDGAALFREQGVDVGASLIVGLLGQECSELARDSVNLMLAGVRFWTNPFYPIPGSPDFERCLRTGLITPTTELALYDQFNFAIGSDRLSPAELYWACVVTQAMAQWTGYLLEGAHARRRGAAATTEQALERLVQHSGDLFGPHGELEVPAVPVAVDRQTVRVHPDGCFHSMQRLDPARLPADSCTFTGDVIAAAVTLHTGVAHGGRQNAGTGSPCAFTISTTLADPVGAAVAATVLTELETALTTNMEVLG